MAARLLREGDRREGSAAGEVTPGDARALLSAWLRALDLDDLDGAQLIARMQDDDFSHGDLFRRACRAHERRLAGAVEMVVAAAHGELDAASAARGLFDACVAAVPYAPAAAFLANEQTKLRAISPAGSSQARGDDAPRVAILADGIGSTHGVSRTIQEIRERGVPGFEIEVVGTDAEVDRRLASVTEIDVPFYPGLRIGVPSLPGVVRTLADGCYDAVHVCSPGPAGIAGALVARALGLPLLGSYHTELAAYAGLRSGQARLVEAMNGAVTLFYSACEIVLSPSAASDQALAQIGIPDERVMRWDRGVDTGRFDPALRRRREDDGAVRVLYSGRITREKGVELLAEAFLAARARDPRLHLMVAGGGPEQERLASLLGQDASFLGWLRGGELAQAYADADVFLFPSSTDTFGQVILEAQASGLPVLAVAEGGPLSLVEDGVTGLLREASAPALAEALVELAAAPLRRQALAAAALRSVRGRTWERTLELLAGRLRPGAPTHRRRAGEKGRVIPQLHRSAIGTPPSGGEEAVMSRVAHAPAGRPRTIAVALHGIEPATFERCAVIRDWLGDHGVDRVTLLVIPARDLHPVGERSPEMVSWLAERRDAGDSIAQHGFQHVCLRRGGLLTHRLGEFSGLDEQETRRAVHAGWRVMKLAGIEPDGFVAPAYAYTAALRGALRRRFHWWADVLRVHRVAGEDGEAASTASRAPAFSLAADGLVGRILSPPLVRAGAMLPTATLRLDLHPADLRHARHMMALEWVLQRSRGREAVTYRQLAGA